MSLESFHRPAEPRLIALPFRGGLRWLARVALAAAPLLGGCAVTMPVDSMMPADDVTGSLATVPFGQLLDEEDRRREKAALATALDPQGDGSTVHWENPKTRRKGSITAVSHAYPADNQVCRGFTGELVFDDSKRTTEGTACIVSAGEWALKQAKAAKKA